MRIVAIASLVALAACEPPPDSPPPPAPSTSGVTSETDPGAPGIPAPATIVGEYRVAGADGLDMDLDWAMTVSIKPDLITLNSQCIRQDWPYTYQGGVLTTGDAQHPICERGHAPVEIAAMASLDGATQVRRTKSNSLELSGKGHSITLFSQ